MSTVVTCTCGKRLKVRDDRLGTTVTCPGCQQPLTLGEPLPTIATDSPAPTEPPTRRLGGTMPRASLVLGITSGVLAILLLSTVVVLRLRSGELRTARTGIAAIEQERDGLAKQSQRLEADIAEVTTLATDLRQQLTDSTISRSLGVTQQEMMNALSWLAWEDSTDKRQKQAQHKGASIFLQNDMSEVTLIGTFGEDSAKGSKNEETMTEFLRMWHRAMLTLTPKWNVEEWTAFTTYASKAGTDKYGVTATIGGIEMEVLTTKISNPPIRVVALRKDR